MVFTKSFSQVNRNDIAQVGGKGASLVEMTQAGISVPPGFVVLAETFECFLDETNIRQELEAIFGTIRHGEMHTVEHASERIQGLINGVPMPQKISIEILHEWIKLGSAFVAVRSSATAEDGKDHAWAGQLNTYLNTQEEAVLRNVQKCWASLFTPRAIFYRFEKGLHTTRISVAVVIQKMIQSEISGIAFSVHPVTENRNQLIIEAGYGLGEAIVSGQVTPDSYVVTKDSLEISDINIATQTRGLFCGDSQTVNTESNLWRDIEESRASLQKLNDVQIRNLSKTIILIEEHFGFPCDIEWAYEDGTFYITQCRPITTLAHTVLLNASENHKNSITDFELTFEGQGMPYIYEVALYKYYLPKNSISIVEHGVVREYMHKDTLRDMDMSGSRMTSHDVKECIKNMDAAVAKGKSICEETLRNRITETSLRNVFSSIGAVTHAYYYFDPHFFDTLFTISSTNNDAYEAVKLVQEYKNVAREEFNQFHFGDGYMTRTLSQLSNQIGVPISELQQYSEEELIMALSGKLLSEEILAERAERYVMVQSNVAGEWNMYTGHMASGFVSAFFSMEVGVNNVICVSGKTAHAPGGLVVGRVYCITRNYTDIGSMQKEMNMMPEGSILVTQTTDPEMMPALRKAIAAITDIGGMLSHTAITARELNIPCIVDTKIATQVLKNGDLIEVDARAGIVRILNDENSS